MNFPISIVLLHCPACIQCICAILKRCLIIYIYLTGCHKVAETSIESSHNLTNNGIRQCTAVCNKRGVFIYGPGYFGFGLKVTFNQFDVSQTLLAYT